MTPALIERITPYISKHYTLDDFPKATEAHWQAALAFRRVLAEVAGEDRMKHVLFVPMEHVSSSSDPGGLAIIYEEAYQIAENIQGVGCGRTGADRYEALNRELRSHGVFMECINHWSAGFYND